MNCHNCNKDLPEEAVFCMACGTKQERNCQCGAKLPNEAMFCMICGTKVRENVEPNKESSSFDSEDKFWLEFEAEPESEYEAEPDYEEEEYEEEEEDEEYAEEEEEEEYEEECYIPEPTPVVEPPQPKAKKAKSKGLNLAGRFMGHYGSSIRAWQLPSCAFYDEKLYIIEDDSEIYVSDEDGSDKELLFKIEDYATSIEVNEAGIFLQSDPDNASAGIRQYDFSGNYVKTLDIPSHSVIKQTFYDGGIVYVVALTNKEGSVEELSPEERRDLMETGEEELFQRLYCINFQDGTVEGVSVGWETPDLNIRYAKGNTVVIEAIFQGEVNDWKETRAGYYRVDVAKKTRKCLSHATGYEPHLMENAMSAYEKAEDKDCKKCQGREIPFFSPDGTMWVVEKHEQGEFLCPYTLTGKEALLLRFPVPKEMHQLESCYFDGETLIHTPSYYELNCYFRYAPPCKNRSRDGHGDCKEFVVLHGCLYTDLDTYGLKRYSMENNSIKSLNKV